MKPILLASNNSHKIFEFRNALSAIGWSLVTPADLQLEYEVEETGTTFDENASLKSNFLFQKTNTPCIADDSGLCVEALQGAPGVYSARYGLPHFNDKDRALYLLDQMKSHSNRNCFYFASLSLTDSTGTRFFHGKCEGVLEKDYDEEGKHGFGYDPIFYYPPLQNRFSRIPIQEKNKVSHRAQALSQLIQFLVST
jgi:XTP/dITP diphosphohydrolase